jgi:hypothetical protein
LPGPGQQFLAGSRFAQQQDGGIGWGHGLDLVEHPHPGRAAADDLAGGEVAPDLLFQEQLFLGQLVPEQLDLPVGLGIVHRDGHLGPQAA